MGDYRGRRVNHASRGRRVYASPDTASEWEPSPRTWKSLAQNEEDSRRRDDDGSSNLHDAEDRRKFRDQETRSSQAVVSSRNSVSQEGKAETDLRCAAMLLLKSAPEILFEGLCESCSANIKDRLTSIATGVPFAKLSKTDVNHSCNEEGKDLRNDNLDERDKWLDSNDTQHDNRKWVVGSSADSNGLTSSNIIRSAFRAIHDAPAYRTRSLSQSVALPKAPEQGSSELAESNPDQQRILNVIRKKDFCLFDQVNGQTVNILEGLELHKNVFDEEEQQDLINYVYELQELGRSQKLRNRTYSEPRKWMRGKGRVTIQFGCCYNYAVDKDGNPPGIIREEEVDEIPPKFRMIIKRLVEWQVLPPTCIPDSCIVNIYDVGDCIPPHIDHHDFVRPFCTLSLLSECNIIIGTNLKIAGPGDFVGSFSLPLPTGSVLILNGNGADVAKHAVPAVPTQRISITFRKMLPSKVPASFKPDKELLATRPYRVIASHPKSSLATFSAKVVDKSPIQRLNSDGAQFSLESDFPVLAKPLACGSHPHSKARKLRV